MDRKNLTSLRGQKKSFTVFIIAFWIGVVLVGHAAGEGSRQQMAIWTFGTNAAGYTETATDEIVAGAPTIALSGGTKDLNGEDGREYTDFNGILRLAGQAAAWDNIATGSEWIVTINTTNWRDIIIRWDYDSDNSGSNRGPASFDFSYRIGSGDWVTHLNDQPLTRDDNWYPSEIDLSTIDGLEDQPSIKFRWSDHQGGTGTGGEFWFDNLEITGIGPIAGIRLRHIATYQHRSVQQFGWSAAVPVPADYDGDGRTDIAVYHPAAGMWYILGTKDGLRTQQFGWSAAVPVPADYDGDGKTDIAVYHPADGMWYILGSEHGYCWAQFGWSVPKPVPGKYYNDQRANLALYDQSAGLWHFKDVDVEHKKGNSECTLGNHTWSQFGWSAADPVPADYDGDGKTDIAVYHPGMGMWYINVAGSEIGTYDPIGKKLVVTGKAKGAVDVLDISNPANPLFTQSIDLHQYGPEPTSVAYHSGKFAISVKDGTKPGKAVILDAGNYGVLKAIEVGSGPDMVTFTPDGQKILVANEGEPNKDYSQDPEGSITIIDVAQWITCTASFSSYNPQRDALISTGIRIFGPTNPTVAQDLEPEYITVSSDSSQAWITLQENNAVALLDIGACSITALFPVGYKDHQVQGNGLDASDQDNKINIANWPVKGMYQPDGIASYVVNGSTYLITANEGDPRAYEGFVEEIRVRDVCPGIPDMDYGRLFVTKYPPYNLPLSCANLYAFGGRSFSIWKPGIDSVTQLWDSGDNFEQITAKYYPEFFNSKNDEDKSFDKRSDRRGPWPESVVVGDPFGNGRKYAFIALEQIGGIMAYDVTNPLAPTFETYENTRNFEGNINDGTAGDRGSEGLVLIPQIDSPTGNPLLVVFHEMSWTTTIFEIQGAIGVNNLVKFPITDTPQYIADAAGCPSGFVGKFSFSARLSSNSSKLLDGLAVKVTTLTNGNLLQNADEGPGGVGSVITVPKKDGFLDAILSKIEFVDVPFSLCLKQRVPFKFFVDVLGIAE